MKVLPWIIIGLLFLFISGCGWRFRGSPVSDSISTETIVKTGGQQLTAATNKIGWLPFLSIIGIGLSVAAFFNGSSKAVGGVAGCSVILLLSLAVARYAAWLAIGSIAIGVVFIILSLLNKDKGICYDTLFKRKGKK